MKVAVLMNSTMAEPSVTTISRNYELVGVGVGSIGLEDEGRDHEPGESGRVPIQVFKKSTHETEMSRWLREIEAEVVLAYTFNFRISLKCLEIPRYGFFNFHPGSLPSDRGNPLFWTILHGRKECILTVHRMTEWIDHGPIYGSARYPIDSDTTFGAALTGLAESAEELTLQLLEDLQLHGPNLLLECQDHSAAKYYPQPNSTHLEIDWEVQSASDIQALVNACNPYCEGAVACVEGRDIRILEAGPFEEAIPKGMVARGVPLPVASGDLCFRCGDGSVLRVDVVYDSDGYFSGRRWLRRRASRMFSALNQ